MKQSTIIAQVQLADHSQLTVRIVYPSGRPPFVETEWPERPTVTSLISYDQMIATVMRVLAVASVELASRQAGKR